MKSPMEQLSSRLYSRYSRINNYWRWNLGLVAFKDRTNFSWTCFIVAVDIVFLEWQPCQYLYCSLKWNLNVIGPKLTNILINKNFICCRYVSLLNWKNNRIPTVYGQKKNGCFWYNKTCYFFNIVVSIEFSPLSAVELTTNRYQLHNGDYG